MTLVKLKIPQPFNHWVLTFYTGYRSFRETHASYGPSKENAHTHKIILESSEAFWSTWWPPAEDPLGTVPWRRVLFSLFRKLEDSLFEPLFGIRSFGKIVQASDCSKSGGWGTELSLALHLCSRLVHRTWCLCVPVVCEGPPSAQLSCIPLTFCIPEKATEHPVVRAHLFFNLFSLSFMSLKNLSVLFHFFFISVR